MGNSLKMARLDFFVMKSQLFTFLSLAPILLMFGLMGASAALMGIHAAWYTALLVACNIFAIQEKNGLDRLYGSVALKLEDIVLGRYVFMLLLYFASFIVAMAMHCGFALYRSHAPAAIDILLGLGISFLAFSTIVSMQTPLYFKMGFIKGRAWSMLPFFALMLMLLVPIAPHFVPALSSWTGAIERVQGNPPLLICLGLSAGCAMLLASYRLSVAAYRKRKRG